MKRLPVQLLAYENYLKGLGYKPKSIKAKLLILNRFIPLMLKQKKSYPSQIKAEDIRLFLEPRPEATEFTVYAVLPSGPEQYVQVKRGDRVLMIRETRQLDLKMDQPVWVSIESSAVNLYNPASGAAISMDVSDKPVENANGRPS